MATLPDPPPPSIDAAQVDHVLDGLHQILFKRAIQNILNTKIAQIIDGLPLKNVEHATAGLSWEPTLNNHEHLCPGSFGTFIVFRESFESPKMILALETLSRYQKTPPGSSELTLPLIELVGSVLKSYPCPHNKTLNEIPQCNDLWLHPSRKSVTHRVCAVTEDQLAKLVQFLESENPGDQKACPSPILVDNTYRRRVDNEIAMPEHKIYRDRWERRMRFRNFEDYEFVRGGTCAGDEVDLFGRSLGAFRPTRYRGPDWSQEC